MVEVSEQNGPGETVKILRSNTIDVFITLVRGPVSTSPPKGLTAFCRVAFFLEWERSRVQLTDGPRALWIEDDICLAVDVPGAS